MKQVRAVSLILALFVTGGADGAADAATAKTQSIDRFMRAFLKKHKVPGASLAITRNGKLVYARGFGWANRERKIPVKADSLFRIASISKPITAVAIMKLVEAGRFNLDDRMMDLLTDRIRYRASKPFDARLNDITVRDLLQHSGGWDRGRSFAPMSLGGHLMVANELKKKPPCDTRDVMTFMFRRPLQFDPGTGYAYSNFGYLILGRIIEDVTGMRYESYVRKELLVPAGATATRIGHMPEELRVKKEVWYYDEKKRTATAPFGPQRGRTVSSPYARPMQVMDAHGGWISSAIELVRFASAIDDNTILNQRSTRAMFSRPAGKLGLNKDGTPKAAFYALGWSVRPRGRSENTWHTGSIQGTSTLLVRRHDGFNWAVLFNANSNPDDKRLASLIDGKLHGVVNAVKEWPKDDVFAEQSSDSKRR
ncbi:MAG: hypothetical protein CMO80_01955 [Verrucomicrobiales bacterium]|nr:hypothetical protein [Verrucomicrobiales bacterium]